MHDLDYDFTYWELLESFLMFCLPLSLHPVWCSWFGACFSGRLGVLFRPLPQNLGGRAAFGILCPAKSLCRYKEGVGGRGFSEAFAWEDFPLGSSDAEGWIFTKFIVADEKVTACFLLFPVF